MQQIQNVLSGLSVAGEANAVDATSLGPAVQFGGEKSNQKQTDAGFGQVLQKERSQAEAEKPGHSGQVNRQNGDAARQADGAAGNRNQQGRAEQGGDAAAEEQGRSGNIMPPPEDSLPPARGERANLAADQLTDADGDVRPPEAGAPADRPSHELIDAATDTDAEQPIPMGVPGSRQGASDRPQQSGMPARAAEAAISARASGGNSEAAIESGRDFGEGVQESRQAIRSARSAETGQQAAPGIDDLVAGEPGVRKDAGPQRAELAAGRVNPVDIEADVQAPRVTPLVNVAAADAASTNSVRPGAVLQAGMEPPAGARIAVGQEGWNTLIAQRIANLAARGSTGAEIQLDPPDLGPIKVTIQMSGDQTASVTVQSHSQAVRDALEQSAHRLRELFNQSGLDLSSLDVSDHGLPRGHSDDHGDAGPVGASRADESGHAEAAPLAEAGITVVANGHPGRIDFYI